RYKNRERVMARGGTDTPAKVRRRPGPRAGRPAPAGTRNDLLRAGADVFSQRGFDGATAELIAKRAGTTKAMINYHFRTKQGLYEAILLATFEELGRRLDAVRAAGGPAPDQLRAFIETFARAAGENPHFPAMMLREVLSGGAHLPEHLFLRLVGVVGVIRGIVEQGMKERSFRPVDPLLTHLSLVGGLLIFFATEPFRRKAAPRVVKGGPPTASAFVEHVQELMVRGLAAETAARRRS
ncbi:MAG TPA: TetR/AcrR family transcriptional regulator, partial [Vicinamibacteria bacterium]|nr:TetR/AcrR family transcriptional regulator [Vicinamibacteria bacterium]